MKTFSDFPNVAAVEAKRTDLQVQRNAKQKQLDELQSGRSQDRGLTPTQAKATALLAGDDSPVESQSKIAALKNDLAVLEEAIRMQTKIVDTEKAKASAEIAKSVLPDYKSRVAKLGKALKELDSAMAAEEAFRDELNAGGISYSAVIPIQGFQPAPKLDLRDRIEAWFTEARGNGYSV